MRDLMVFSNNRQSVTEKRVFERSLYPKKDVVLEGLSHPVGTSYISRYSQAAFIFFKESVLQVGAIIASSIILMSISPSYGGPMQTGLRSDELDRGIRYVLWNVEEDTQSEFTKLEGFSNLDSTFDSPNIADFDVVIVSVSVDADIDGFFDRVPLDLDVEDIKKSIHNKRIHAISMIIDGRSTFLDLVFVPTSMHDGLSKKCVASGLYDVIQVPDWTTTEDGRLLSLFDCD